MTEIGNPPQSRSFMTHVLSLRRWEKNFLLLGFRCHRGRGDSRHTYLTGDTSGFNHQSPVARGDARGYEHRDRVFPRWALRSALRLALSFALVLVLIWWAFPTWVGRMRM